jgi:hypothetical protein
LVLAEGLVVAAGSGCGYRVWFWAYFNFIDKIKKKKKKFSKFKIFFFKIPKLMGAGAKRK